MNTQELMNKEVLTAEERDFVNSTNPEWVKEFLFHNSWNNTYLNLDVYSEVKHEERQFEMLNQKNAVADAVIDGSGINERGGVDLTVGSLLNFLIKNQI